MITEVQIEVDDQARLVTEQRERPAHTRVTEPAIQAYAHAQRSALFHYPLLPLGGE